MKKFERVAKKNKNRDLRARRTAYVKLCGYARLPERSEFYRAYLDWDPFEMKKSALRCTFQPKARYEVLGAIESEMLGSGLDDAQKEKVMDGFYAIMHASTANDSHGGWISRLLWIHPNERMKNTEIPFLCSLVGGSYSMLRILTQMVKSMDCIKELVHGPLQNQRRGGEDA